MHEWTVVDLAVRDDAITGTVLVPEDLPAFDGHFPGRPILPGVAQLDLVLALAQRALGHRVRLVAVRRMKFSSTVTPGMVLAFRLEPNAASGRLSWSLATPRAEASSGVIEIAVEAP